MSLLVLVVAFTQVQEASICSCSPDVLHFVEWLKLHHSRTCDSSGCDQLERNEPIGDETFCPLQLVYLPATKFNNSEDD